MKYLFTILYLVLTGIYIWFVFWVPDIVIRILCALVVLPMLTVIPLIWMDDKNNKLSK